VFQKTVEWTEVIWIFYVENPETNKQVLYCFGEAACGWQRDSRVVALDEV